MPTARNRGHGHTLILSCRYFIIRQWAISVIPSCSPQTWVNQLQRSTTHMWFSHVTGLESTMLDWNQQYSVDWLPLTRYQLHGSNCVSQLYMKKILGFVPSILKGSPIRLVTIPSLHLVTPWYRATWRWMQTRRRWRQLNPLQICLCTFFLDCSANLRFKVLTVLCFFLLAFIPPECAACHFD